MIFITFTLFKEIEITSNFCYKFTLIKAFCKAQIELNSTKILNTKTKYTILIGVNVSNIGTKIMHLF